MVRKAITETATTIIVITIIITTTFATLTNKEDHPDSFYQLT